MDDTQETQYCATCGMKMRLARITPRLGGMPELRTFECTPCKVVVTIEQENNKMQPQEAATPARRETQDKLPQKAASYYIFAADKLPDNMMASLHKRGGP